ncbi:MAG: GNAT family N-acetyltransferase [Acidimicrobiales bacterium]
MERRVTGTDGHAYRLRPIRPDDADALVAFHNRLSTQSVYQRYFSLHPVLSPGEVTHLTTVDYVDRMAFVVEDDDGLVAVARYDRYPASDEAEVAFLVSDDHQRRGLGRRLLDELAAAARERGVTSFVAETQVDNASMLGLFMSSGYPLTRTTDDGVVCLHFSIGST